MSNIGKLGSVLNGSAIPKTNGLIPAYGGNGIISFVDNKNYSGETIVIGRVGANCGNIQYVDGDCWITDNALAMKVKDEYDAKYVYYLLKQLNLNNFHIGSSQPLLTQGIINKIDFDYTEDKKTQEKIATVLYLLDTKIENNNKVNSELESLAKTIYDYWFLQFEFPNEEGKPYKSSGGKMVWNDELKREIPEEWEVKSLSEIVIENEKSKTQVGDVSDVGNYPFFTSGESILKSNKHIVDGMNCYLSTGGNATLKFFDGEADYSTDTWCISASNDYKYMLYMYLKSILPMMDIKFFHGTGLKHLQKPLLLKEIVIIPSKSILNKFNNIVEASFITISKKYNENQELASLRDFLLPMLMNGQVTFKDENY